MIFTCLLASLLLQPEAEPVRAMSAKAFADSIGIHSGVNTYKNASADFSDQPFEKTFFEDVVQPRMSELGVRHFRCFLPNDLTNLDRLRQLGISRIRLQIITVNAGKITNDLDKVRTDLEYLAPYLEGIEGPNEPDGVGDPDWVNKTAKYTKDLRAMVRSSLLLEKIDVLGSPLTRGKWLPTGTNFAVDADEVGHFADVGNMHMYDFPVDHAPTSYDGKAYDWRVKPYKGKPLVLSETGFATYGGDRGVSREVQSKYLLRRLIDYHAMGYQRMYIFNLIDLANRPLVTDSNFGLLTHNNQPKPSFGALKRMIALLRQGDKGTGSGYPEISIAGAPKSVEALALRRANGSTLLALWNRKLSKDEDQTAAVRVTLSDSRNCRLWDPRTENAKAIASFEETKSLTIGVPDALVFLEIDAP